MTSQCSSKSHWISLPTDPGLGLRLLPTRAHDCGSFFPPPWQSATLYRLNSTATSQVGLRLRALVGNHLGWFVLGTACLAFLLGILLFPPRSLVVADEALYLDQAIDLAHGKIGHDVIDPLTGDVTRWVVDAYPLGTAALLAPAYALGGWTALHWVPALCWIAALLLTGRLLADRRLSVLPALLVGIFLPSLFAGRLLMSDAPSAAIVAFALVAFFRAFEGRQEHAAAQRWALVAGLAAGLSTLFRETNVLVLAPFCVGALIRRERLAWPLFWGGLVGISTRVLSSYAAFGAAFAGRTMSTFGTEALVGNLAVYGFVLLVLFPGGLLAAVVYRGPRRTELITAAFLYTLLFCLYEWRGQDSGLLKSLVLGPRFFLPLTPLLALAVADLLPRLPHHARPLVAPSAVALSLASIPASFAIHPTFSCWSTAHDSIRELIYEHTPDHAIILTNTLATGKYLHRSFGPRTVVDLDRLSDLQAAELIRLHPVIHIVLLERFDSEAWEHRSLAALQRIQSFTPNPTSIVQQPVPSIGRLRIWQQCK